MFSLNMKYRIKMSLELIFCLCYVYYRYVILFHSWFVIPHNTGPLWTVAVKALIYVKLIETEMNK